MSAEAKAIFREESFKSRLYFAKSFIEDTLLQFIPEDLVCYPPSDVNPEGGPLVRDVLDSHLTSFLEDIGPVLTEIEDLAKKQREDNARVVELLGRHPKKKD